MFASGTGSMRGPWVKTPLLLLLLLLLLTALTKTVLCDDEYTAADEAEATETGEEEAVEAEAAQEDAVADGGDGGDGDGGDGGTEISETTPTVTDSSSTPSPDPSFTDENTPVDATLGPDFTGPTDITPVGGDGGLSLIIILIPVVLVVLIIGLIVCGIFINRRWNEKARNQELRKEDPYLDGSSTEKVPMPMFEEDVPSVLELEMEELDQWMKKDGETAKDSTLA